MLPKGSSAVTVTVNAVPAFTTGGTPVTTNCVAAAGRTSTVTEPLIDGAESLEDTPVAVSVCWPAVRNAPETVTTPPPIVTGPGRTACGSVLVKTTVPAKSGSTLPKLSSAV